MELSDAISGRTVQQILSEIHKTREVIKVKELRARHVGVVTYIDAIISVSPHIGITEADVIASKIERNLLAVVGRGSIMLHLEPADFGIPVEDKLKSAADLVEGADDLHKLSVTNVDGGLYVIIHIHVNPSLTLEEADKIAEEVESNIKKADPTVKQVTVHLEPASPKRANGVIIKDKRLVEAVKDIAQSYPGVVEVDSIVVYSAEEKVRVNVHCLFEGNHNVAKVHETVSRIEEAIRRRIPNAEVTVHSEPASDQQTTKTTANEQTPS
jgi:divalent metal cation (Fe/Co/Zn/Cd) transporter